jgi:DNA-binding transcriptional regulator YhcF (GntR family)
MTLPLYLQIIDDINSKLLAKELKADNRLESHAELAMTMV